MLHKNHSHLKQRFDFSEFWDGAPESVDGLSTWGGGFRGRPALANDLMPAVRLSCKGIDPRRITKIRSCLRSLWRFMDDYEKWCTTEPNSNFSTHIERLEDINTRLLLFWKLPAPSGEWAVVSRNTYIPVTALIKLARNQQALPEIIIPIHQREDLINRREIPDENVGKQLVRALIKRAKDVFNRWDRADALAAHGRNLLGMERTIRYGKFTLIVDGGVTEADLHATYRAAVAKNNNLPISKPEFLSLWGFANQKPSWWPTYSTGHPEAGHEVPFLDLPHGLYPSSGETAALMLLFMARTGWNQSTVENLDISADEKWFKQYQSKYLYLFAYKHRAGDWMDTVSHVRRPTMPYQIVRRLQARTAVLRDAVKTNPALCNNAVIARYSPWIYWDNVSKLSTSIGALPSNGTLRAVLKAAIRDSNASSTIQIPEALAPSDLRDIFIGAAYMQDLSVFIAQLAAGHKSLKMTFDYLRRRAWRAESEACKNALFTALVDQIETHRKIDLTLLRAQMDGIEVTEDMVANLELYRNHMTYSGVACTDPTHPPAFIDGSNPRDGTMPCAQQHQCVLCPKGRVFNESLPLLARRYAELVWLEENMPMEVLAETTIPYELKVTQATLTQWPSTEVQTNLAHWTQLIQTGVHRPIRFSGEM